MTDYTVLVVEDNDKNLKLVRDVLEFAGFRVLSADNAEVGIELAVQGAPDLILMDLQLPGMNGFEALQVLRDQEATCDVPVVAVTANAMTDDRERAIDEGFDGFLTKPIDIRAFPAQVRAYLPASEESP